MSNSDHITVAQYATIVQLRSIGGLSATRYKAQGRHRYVIIRCNSFSYLGTLYPIKLGTSFCTATRGSVAKLCD